MSRFFHAIRAGECRFITGQAPWRLTPRGTTHTLAVACAAPAHAGGPYCQHHKALTASSEPPRRPFLPESARTTAAPPRAEREPDLCQLLS